jgi:hypothetical protein
MSRTSRNFIIAYILLVGLPLIGLAGVLKTGRHLAAPIAIDGTWKMDIQTANTAGQSCEKAISSLSASSFGIAQSGKTLTMTLQNPSKTSGDGSLEGSSLNVPLTTTDSSIAGCAAGQTLVLTATIEPNSNPRSMGGVMWVTDCPSCAKIQFHAVRQPKSPAGAGH